MTTWPEHWYLGRAISAYNRHITVRSIEIEKHINMGTNRLLQFSTFCIFVRYFIVHFVVCYMLPLIVHATNNNYCYSGYIVLEPTSCYFLIFYLLCRMFITKVCCIYCSTNNDSYVVHRNVVLINQLVLLTFECVICNAPLHQATA